MNKISPETRAVIDAIDKVRWDWGIMREADAETIAVATLRAIVKELKYQSHHHTEEYYQLDVDDILRIADEMEQIK
jgi:hypothetical protein